MSVCRVYVAGAFGERMRLNAQAGVLRALGATVVSTWHDPDARAGLDDALAASAGAGGPAALPATIPNQNSLEQDGFHGKMDIDEVRAADLLVADVSDPDYPYRGTSAEVGAALALGRPVICVWGGRAAVPNPNGGWLYSHRIMQSPFLCHPAISHVDAWSEACALVERIAAAM